MVYHNVPFWGYTPVSDTPKLDNSWFYVLFYPHYRIIIPRISHEIPTFFEVEQPHVQVDPEKHHEKTEKHHWTPATAPRGPLRCPFLVDPWRD